MPDSVTPSPADTEFPVPLSRFLPTLVGTPDEVWSKLLKLDYSSKPQTMSQWRKILSKLKGA